MTKSAYPATRFNLDTCQDMHEKLKWEAQRLQNGWSVYDSFNFVITAHHLYYDWIKSCGSQCVIDKKNSLPTLAQTVMQAIADLSNGNKHWQITSPKTQERQVITRVYEPVINDWYAYFITGPMVYVEFGDYKVSMATLVNQVLGYFKWIFEDCEITFPVELLEHLELFRIHVTSPT